MRNELDRFVVPARGRGFDARDLLHLTGAATVEELWNRLASRTVWPAKLSLGDYEAVCPGEIVKLRLAAENACRHRIDLMGSGLVDLGDKIDWHRDYKTGDRWPVAYFRGIDYVNRGRPSDVKTVWELSRMQWLVPAAQLYVLTGEERYAHAVRVAIDQWLAMNPYACSVNWGVAMEAAMRIFSWTWLFHACARSLSWSDEAFRVRFLIGLYLHAEFVERFIERSDVNGNHFTADAAALVVAGAFFQPAESARIWLASGSRDLEREIPLQVFPDGVDFEASVAYHRLVAELFLHASIWAAAAGRPFGPTYRARLSAMGRFAAAYTRPDETTPLWGDADDARVLPLGQQSITDHRYLPGVIGLHIGDEDLVASSGGSRAEAFWMFGPEAACRLSATKSGGSRAFRDGGVFVMRSPKDHVFIDCGPLGLAGRGGHGHNDLMSFEAMIDGELLIVDCGSYVYTASFEQRNFFRSTAVHNTPRVDGEEINRFISPDYLWVLHNDAQPRVLEWSAGPDQDRLIMSHSGYLRLRNPVRPIRTIVLNHRNHQLLIEDAFEGVGEHEFCIPLQFAPGVEVEVTDANWARLSSNGRVFALHWQGGKDWVVRTRGGLVSRRYGFAEGAALLEWTRRGTADQKLTVQILPVEISYDA